MAWIAPTEAQVADIINTSKHIAVVGVSNKPDRPSFQVAKRLIESGAFEIYLVNPSYEEILGKKVYKTLADIPVKIDVVDVFRKVSELAPVFQSAEGIGAKVIWLQLGLVDQDLANQAESKGIRVVMDRCLKVDYDLYGKKNS